MDPCGSSALCSHGRNTWSQIDLLSFGFSFLKEHSPIRRNNPTGNPARTCRNPGETKKPFTDGLTVTEKKSADSVSFPNPCAWTASRSFRKQVRKMDDSFLLKPIFPRDCHLASVVSLCDQFKKCKTSPYFRSSDPWSPLQDRGF